MPTDGPYSISDLARLTGLSVRTIRYYLAQGLIPASGESGPGAHYGEGHLGRLRLVRRLQQRHLPLAEIRAQLAALTDEQVTALAGTGGAAEPDPETSALDYVRSVLAGSQRAIAPTAPPASAVPPSPREGTAPGVPTAPARALSAPVSPAAMPAMRDTPPARSRLLRGMAMPFLSELADAAGEPALPLATAKLPPALASQVSEPTAPEAAPASPEPPASIERSQWERLSLGPNLELHVRRPLSRLEQKRVERLITIARQVLKEEQP